MKNFIPFLMVAGSAILIFISIRKSDTKKTGISRSEPTNKPTNTGGKTRGQRNNNPFNIRYSEKNNWVGQTGTDGSFCIFDTMGHGIRAGGVLLRNYIKAGNNTISKILTRFAPSTENNTEKYIADVETMSGINRNKGLKAGSDDLWQVAKTIMYIESLYDCPEYFRIYFDSNL